MNIYVFIIVCFIIAIIIISNMIAAAMETIKENNKIQLNTVQNVLKSELDDLKCELTRELNDLTTDNPPEIRKEYKFDSKGRYLDGLIFEVAHWAIETGGISIPGIQRHFSVGYSRANKIIEQLAGLSIIAQCDDIDASGTKKWKINITMEELLTMYREGAI